MIGRIYFIQVGTTGPIKIGFTKADPLNRMEDLQCGCPWPLRLIGSIPGTKRNENWLHEKLSEFKMLREWFVPEVASDVNKILSPGFAWPELGEMKPIDRAIRLAGSQCELSNLTGCHQPTISIARRSGKVPKRIQEFLSLHEASAA